MAGNMVNQALKKLVVDHLLSQVQTPAQYIGGEWNADGQGPSGRCEASFVWRFPMHTRLA